MIEWALKAQARGLHIFPVARRAKVPHPAAGQWGETATNDLNQIISFWSQVDPEANIGIACKQSELLVIDLDMPKEPDKLRGTRWEYLHDAYGPYVSGEALWDEMTYQAGAASENDPGTYSVQTGSGGIHLYYQWPAHWGPISQASPVKGIVDVRGNGGQYGGYVLAEGSVTDAGPYMSLGTLRGPQIAPQWIRTLVTPRPKQPPVRQLQGLRQPGAISYSGLVQSVLNAGEGNRNNALLWAARTMCEEGATEQECLETLGPPAGDAGLGWPEVERTIQSAYRIQRREMYG